mmetsp:Transcript_20375/g.51300  ORF Transcript_20375/g.51300 Transcript_20375/m.51300 type:complete len:213 (-) Transcript_20375:125-763(-)
MEGAHQRGELPWLRRLQQVAYPLAPAGRPQPAAHQPRPCLLPACQRGFQLPQLCGAQQEFPAPARRCCSNGLPHCLLRCHQLHQRRALPQPFLATRARQCIPTARGPQCQPLPRPQPRARPARPQPQHHRLPTWQRRLRLQQRAAGRGTGHGKLAADCPRRNGATVGRIGMRVEQQRQPGTAQDCTARLQDQKHLVSPPKVLTAQRWRTAGP